MLMTVIAYVFVFIMHFKLAVTSVIVYSVTDFKFFATTTFRLKPIKQLFAQIIKEKMVICLMPPTRRTLSLITSSRWKSKKLSAWPERRREGEIQW